MPSIMVAVITILAYKIIAYLNTTFNVVISDVLILFLLFFVSIPIYWFVGMGKLERKRILNIVKRN